MAKCRIVISYAYDGEFCEYNSVLAVATSIFIFLFGIIAVPNLNAPERKFYSKDCAAYDAPRHLYHFNFTTLEKICNKYKFKVIRKYSLYQDTPYNILLSISRKNFINIFKAFFIFVYSMLITLVFGPNYSSSILIICKKY